MDFDDQINLYPRHPRLSHRFLPEDNDFRQKALESEASFDENFCQLIMDTINDLNVSSDVVFHTNTAVPKVSRTLPKDLNFQNAPEEPNQVPENLLTELKNYLQIRIQKDIEKVEEISDNYPLLDMRKAILRIFKAFSELCSIVISTSAFETLVILVIIFNTIVLAMEDPKDDSLSSPFRDFELFFTIFYSIECGLKICSLGLVLNKDSYLRDWWNVLDFLIIFTAWLDTLAGSGFRLSALRSLRVLRPLRGISSVSGMRALIMALANSIKPLISALIVLVFFILVFAIGAVQLWMGVLRQRCLSVADGYYSADSLCGAASCGFDEECVETLDNPNRGVTHFDNIFVAFVTVFQIVTMEGWTSILIYTEDAFSKLSFIYYIPLLFIAGNLILNMTLAIITSTFKEVSETISKHSGNEAVLVDEDIFETIYKNTTKMTPIMVSLSKQAKKIPTFETESAGLSARRIKFDTKLMENAKTSKKIENELENELEIEEQSIELWDKSKAIKPTQMNEPDSPLIEIMQLEYVDMPKTIIQSKKLSVKQRNNLIENNSLKIHKRVSFCPITEEELPNLRKTLSFSKLKQAVTVKQKTLKALKSNPSFIKKSRLELIESCLLTSESFREIMGNDNKPALYSETFEYNFKYREIQTSEPFTEYYTMKIDAIRQKYSKIGSRFEIFRFFYIRKGPKNAFFTLNLNCKKIIREVNENQLDVIGCWSGVDVSLDLKSNFGMIEKYSFMNFRIWSYGKVGDWEKIKFPIKWLMTYKHTNTLIIISVIFNTSCLAYDHYGISQTSSGILQAINNFFTYFFAAELFFRVLGIGITAFLRDFMNYFDVIVVTLSLIEIFIISGGSSAISAFRAIRVFRIFRVLKVVRLFRYLKSLETLIKLIGNSISSLAYLFLLLLLFLFIFTLLSMQIFGGEFNFPEGLPRGNFDNFHWAFVTTFQLLTTENWNDILTSSLRSSLGICSSFFLIFWIILGNFILLNLFLAILLDSVESYKEDKKEEVVEVDTFKRNNLMQMRLDSIERFHDSDSDIDLFRCDTVEVMFKGVECEKSYYLFRKSSFVRISCIKMCRKGHLDNFILVLIILNSSKLVWDTYIIDEPEGSDKTKASEILDLVFTSIFFLEFLIKSIAFGLVKDRMSYLQDSWNKLDFMVVVLSIIDLSVNSIDLPVIKIFRLLRTLRPLRLINHNLSMKIAVSALIDSMIAICNVLIVIFVVWLVFAILGVSLLSGKMHYCSDSNISERQMCESSGFEWKNSDYNFDNVPQAMVTLFIVMSQESWPNRMYEGVDARSDFQSPQQNFNPYIAYYYIVFVVIGNFFMVNLFTVIVFSKFNEAKEKETSFALFFLSKEQILWSEIQKLIIKAKPEFNHHGESLNKFRLFFYRISKSKAFDVFVMAIILLNMLIMAMPYNEASLSYLLAVENMNTVCTYIFIFEAIIKIIGLGGHYFKNYWNIFDFFIVSSSIVDLAIVYSGSSNSNRLLRQGPQLVRVVRLLRISRLLRLVKGLESLKNLLEIITYALPAILNVLSLLLLIFFIYSILGVFLFFNVKKGKILGDSYNFNNFHSAMNVLWRISTGEDYPTIMADCANYYGSQVYIVYYISFVIVIDFVVLELFVSIIIQHYEEFSHNPENALNIFIKDFKIFKKHWLKLTIGRDPFRIHKNDAIDLLNNTCKDLKIFNQNFSPDMIKFVGSLNIPIDSEFYFFFNDVLYAIMKKKYAVIKKTKNSNMLKYLRKEEHNTKLNLKNIREKYFKKNKISENDQAQLVNSIFLKTVVKKWKEYTKKKKEGLILDLDYSDFEYPGENSDNENF